MNFKENLNNIETLPMAINFYDKEKTY